ncbi:jg12117 [Pararge aegeria aegeria]|uniref:Jg12117 protein n=1 Tax=Pararge aegeria aegeria TaxID=348720 RepID=A0A8S4QJG0_9NEOP|nr:jg12117 [Pararge aegeria aegeria]
MTIPHDENLVNVANEKVSKYLNLAHEITAMWGVESTVIVAIVVSVHGLLAKSCNQHLKKLLLEAKHSNISNMDTSWALGIIAGAVGTLIAVAIVALLARKRHHRPLQYEAPLQTGKAYKGALHNHSPLQPDDKNPDVVPLGKDFNCTRDAERPPEPPPYGVVVSPPVGSSRSVHSLHERSNTPHTPHTPNTPASDAQANLRNGQNHFYESFIIVDFA